MEKNNSRVTILVSSCDKYQEAWMPFFSLLSKYWPECRYEKVLSTETLSFNHFDVKTINSPEKTWSSRLLDVLSSIDSEYILFMLEDFFITKEVRAEIIDKYLRYLDEDSDISVIYLKTSTGQLNKSKRYPDLIEMDKGKKYLINFQAALWRKERLMEVLPPGLSPWDIEEKFRWEGNGTFLCVANSSYTNCDNDIIPYLWAQQTGYGICKSHWLWNNKKLFKKEKINCYCRDLPTTTKFQYLIDKYFKNLISKF